MVESRDISTSRRAGGVGVTVAAVRRMATLAERALREAGCTEGDSLLQDVAAARLIAEDALAMEAEGDPLAEPMAKEALRMAKEALKAAQPAEFAEPSKVPAPAASPRPSLADLPEVVPAPAHASSVPAAPSAPVPDPAPGVPAVSPAHADPAPPAEGAASGAPAVPEKRPRAAKRVCLGLAAVLLVLVGLLGAAWWGLLGLPEPFQERILLLPDAHAQEGRLSASEVEAAPGIYQMVLNQVASMQAGSRTLRIAFENPAANDYSSRLVLRLDGTIVAETGMVAPGQYVETVELDRALPAGEHELSAAVLVYSGATQVNTMSADVAVRVK